LTAIFGHPSAEHIFLYCFCFLASFFGDAASSSVDNFRFLLLDAVPFLRALFVAALLRAAAKATLVEVALLRVETSSDEYFFIFLALLFTAAATASAFLS
jgi:hypothetical protein